ncbi:MAG: sigma-54 dependent transcriptional regulator [Oligoflexia bacterium]|nr:sigma-54 dependent transcriptional regulator [Oligoflexia bacterium]
MNKARVLVVDDEDTIRKLLKSRLDREGFDVVTAENAEAAEQALAHGGEPNVLVTDLKMPGKDGFELMGWAKKRNPQLRVIVITGHGEKEAAVKALRQGASDYLEKPFDMDQLVHAVQRCARENELEIENRDLLGRLEARVERVEGKAEDAYWYVSRSPSMAKVNEWLQVLRRESLRGQAEEPATLILGDSGTGKEGVARMIHAGSRRAHGPWVAVNCANFNEQLLDSELFGHERGSFTGATNAKRGLFEIAKGGTLFLDEIGEMDIKLQAKLLRVLQEKVFRRVGGTSDIVSDVRVVAATNRNLLERAQAGQFREDLYHRLSRVVVEMPTLRQRSEDIVPMAVQFAERAFSSRGKTFGGFSLEAQDGLREYPWPGNVRELLNVVERVALISSGEGSVTLKALSLPRDTAATGTRSRLEVMSTTATQVSSTEMGEADTYTKLKQRWADAFEREYLIATLSRNGGNVSAAAREARLDRSNFLRLLRRHKLKAQEYRKAGDTGTDGTDHGHGEAA